MGGLRRMGTKKPALVKGRAGAGARFPAQGIDATRLHATLGSIGGGRVCGFASFRRNATECYFEGAGVRHRRVKTDTCVRFQLVLVVIIKMGRIGGRGEKRHMCRFWAGPRSAVRDELANKYVTVTDLRAGGSERAMGPSWWGRTPKVVTCDRFPVLTGWLGMGWVPARRRWAVGCWVSGHRPPGRRTQSGLWAGPHLIPWRGQVSAGWRKTARPRPGF